MHLVSSPLPVGATYRPQATTVHAYINSLCQSIFADYDFFVSVYYPLSLLSDPPDLDLVSLVESLVHKAEESQPSKQGLGQSNVSYFPR